MLIIRISFSSLSRIKHDILFILLISANQRSTSGGRNHLIAIERKYTILSERPAYSTIITTSQSLRSIFDNRYIVFIGNSHYFIDFRRHSIQINDNNSFRLLSRSSHPVLNCVLQKLRIHIPSIRFAIYQYWDSTKVHNRMTRSTKCKRLANYFITGLNSASDQCQMHSSRPSR